MTASRPLAWLRRLRNLWRGARLDEDIEKELAFHLAERVDDLVAAGVSETEARRTARRRFGGYALQKDRTRDMDIASIGNVWRDIRYGARLLRRSPGFTLVAVLAIGIGTGANITVFGFVNALVFRPLDATEATRLVRVFGEGGNAYRALVTNSEAYIPLDDYVQYRERNQSFTGLAAQFIGGPASVRTDGPAQMIPVMPVSGNYFETVGVVAAIGRTFGPDDARHGAPGVIVLSDEGWRRFFNADPDVVGKAAAVNGFPVTIVGITPKWFKGTASPMVPQIYTPIAEDAATAPFGWSPFKVWLIGRLKAGVTGGEARADLLRIAAQLTTQDQQRRPLELYPARVLMPVTLAPLSAVAAMFTLIVGVVLLIACDNVAILILTRSAIRRHEIGVRVALGATRGQLITQLLAESLLLSAAGALVGLFVAYVTARSLTQVYLPVPMPFALTFDFDWRVALFTIGISFVATLLCGLAPALQSMKLDVVSTLRQSGVDGGSNVRSGLIVAQTTLSTALLVIAVVLVHSLTAPVASNSGFASQGVLLSTITVVGQQYSPERRAAFIERMLDRLSSTPVVSSVAVVDTVPLANNAPISEVDMRSDGRLLRVYASRVSPGLFRTLSIPLVSGRDFVTQDDGRSRPVGIVNETLARLFWPGENPIGKQLLSNDGSVTEVVGLARDSKYQSVQEEPKAFLYRPMAQDPVSVPSFLIKSSADPALVFSLVRAVVAEIDRDLVPFNLMTLDQRLGLGRILNRAAATVTASMGLLALALGSVGLFGTISLLVQQRRHEIGVRMALGASSSAVMSLITRQGMRWIAPGLVLGLVGGALATLGLSRFVRNVPVMDPLALLLTPLVLAGVAYIACYIPASRASRLDPLDALRDE